MGENLNVNVRVSSKRANINVNGRGWTQADRLKSLNALNNARALVVKFGPEAEHSIAFFRKCFNRLGEAKTWDLYDYAMSRRDQDIKTSRLKYFIGVAKRQSEMRD